MERTCFAAILLKQAFTTHTYLSTNSPGSGCNQHRGKTSTTPSRGSYRVTEMAGKQSHRTRWLTAVRQASTTLMVRWSLSGATRGISCRLLYWDKEVSEPVDGDWMRCVINITQSKYTAPLRTVPKGTAPKNHTVPPHLHTIFSSWYTRKRGCLLR